MLYAKKSFSVETKLVPIRLSEKMIESIDLAIELGQGNDRNGIIRMAIANYLRELDITNEIKKRKN